MSNFLTQAWKDLVNDPILHPVEDALSSAWNSVKSNPIGAITSAILIAEGVPPAWAGMWGGAAGTAAQGGNAQSIIKAGITGAAMGYMGQAAGAAAGSAGSLAQAAAAGAASSVTGAILTGQDVLTAAKQGLILGSVMAGGQKVYQLMTPTEAIASVPKDVIANTAATSNDPLGDLINKMGWTSSDSAVAAASKAFSQNSATTQQMLTDSIPDYVLKNAAALPSNQDPAAYIAKELGWNQTNLTIGAANNAVAQYKVASAPAKTTTPTSGSAPSQATIDTIASNNGITVSDAEVLAHNGYTNSDVQSLIKAGYTSSDLVDLASTGVPATTVTQLSTTPIPEATISSLLEKGVSAIDIGNSSQFIKTGQLTVSNAEKLLDQGWTSNSIRDFAINGKTDSVIKAGEAGLTKDTIAKLNNAGGWDLNKIQTQISKGLATPQQINDLLANNTSWGSGLNKILSNTTPVTQTQPVAPTNFEQLTTPTAGSSTVPSTAEAQILAQNGFTSNDIQTLVKAGYTPTELVDLSSTGITANTLKTLSASPIPETQISSLLHDGISANDIANASNYVSNGQINVQQANSLLKAGMDAGNSNYTVTAVHNNMLTSDQAAKLLQAGASGTDIYNIGNMAKTGLVSFDTAAGLYEKGYNVNQIRTEAVNNTADKTLAKLTQPAPAPATQPTQTIPVTLEDGTVGQYNPTTGEVTDSSGKSVQTAQNQPQVPDTTVAGDYKVNVGGVPRYAGQEGAGTPPSGFQVAKPEDVFGPNDTGSANKPFTPGTYYDAETNTWYTPEVKQEPVPIVPPQDTTLPVNPSPVPVPPIQIAPVENPPSEGTGNIGGGGGTTPAPVAPVENNPAPITQPPATTAPTVISSTNYVGSDGGTYRLDTYSDGSSHSTLISGPSTGGTTGGTTDGTTDMGNIDVTAPKEPGVPVDEAPHHDELPVETPEEPYVPPIVPIVPPVTTPPSTGGGYNLKYGTPIQPQVPHTLNPGWITNVPDYYKTTNDAQSHYYWGGHPYQTGSTFDPTLYNQIPNAPQTPFGLGFAQTAATPQQIMSKMGNFYPLLNSVSGAVKP